MRTRSQFTPEQYDTVLPHVLTMVASTEVVASAVAGVYAKNSRIFKAQAKLVKALRALQVELAQERDTVSVTVEESGDTAGIDAEASGV